MYNNVFQTNAMGLRKGRLLVTVLEAQELKDQDWFGKMDPFVYVIIGRQQQQTAVANNQGRNPRWNQEFIFTVEPGSMTEMIIRVFDKDLMSNDFVGSVSIPLGIFNDCKSKDFWYDLAEKSGKRAGRIHIAATHQPDPVVGLAPQAVQTPPPQYGYPQQPPLQYPPPSRLTNSRLCSTPLRSRRINKPRNTTSPLRSPTLSNRIIPRNSKCNMLHLRYNTFKLLPPLL